MNNTHITEVSSATSQLGSLHSQCSWGAKILRIIISMASAIYIKKTIRRLWNINNQLICHQQPRHGQSQRDHTFGFDLILCCCNMCVIAQINSNAGFPSNLTLYMTEHHSELTVTLGRYNRFQCGGSRTTHSGFLSLLIIKIKKKDKGSKPYPGKTCEDGQFPLKWTKADSFHSIFHHEGIYSQKMNE